MSTKPHNIFISWSGPRSKHVAKALNDWLPTVLQSARPWFSTLSIDKGSRPLEEIASALDSIQVGISCLTPENLTAAWILYEAGALSKRIGKKSRLCTYLLGGLKPEDVAPPLGMFQHTRADKEETRHMLHSINHAISEEPVPEVALERLFERMWPDLEKEISSMPSPEADVPAQRDLREMVAEVLEMMRTDAERKKKVDFMDEYIPMMKSLFPVLDAAMKMQRAQSTGQQYEEIPWDAWGSPEDKKCPRCGNTQVSTGAKNVVHCNKCGVVGYDRSSGATK